MFEQSGTFKHEFEKLGIPAKDYDLLNNYGETDWVGDLFAQIESAYAGKSSIFDEISANALIMAFFPCTYFSDSNQMFFEGTNFAWRNLSRLDVLDKIIERAQLRNDYYIMLIKFCSVIEQRGLRAIIENPYNAHHYWQYNFPYRPKVIDMNRRLRGDYYKKPTQYLYINCSPSGNRSLQLDKEKRYIKKQSTEERSMISPEYAHNFICDHILGIESGHTILTLF